MWGGGGKGMGAQLDEGFSFFSVVKIIRKRQKL